MELIKTKKTIKYVVYCAIILLAALLQNVSGLFPEIGNARCFFLIPVSILLSINENSHSAALLGLFGGFLWDMVSVQHMGFNCIYLMFICYMCAAFVNYVFRNTFITGLIAAAVAVILYCFMYWLIFVLISSPEGAGRALAHFYLPCAVYTIVLTPVIEAAVIPIKSKVSGTRQLDD